VCVEHHGRLKDPAVRANVPGGARPRAARPDPKGEGEAAQRAGADRLGELHLQGRNGVSRVGADEQVLRGVPRQALLRWQHHRRLDDLWWNTSGRCRFVPR